MYPSYFKRPIDIFFSLSVLLLFLPIGIVISLILIITTKESPLFFQLRPGLHGKLFNIVKFKTMNNATDAHGNLLPDSKRLTAIGQFIRKTSLDEFPQLINVLKGDMSIIGPRPLLPEYLSLYNETQKKRHHVRPGITGWAQVNGRNTISWQQKFDYDVWYVNHLSFLLDLKIVFLTIKKVVVKEGISAENSVSMEKFKGN